MRFIQHQFCQGASSLWLAVEGIGDERCDAGQVQWGEGDMVYNGPGLPDLIHRQHQWMGRAHFVITIRPDEK